MIIAVILKCILIIGGIPLLLSLLYLALKSFFLGIPLSDGSTLNVPLSAKKYVVKKAIGFDDTLVEDYSHLTYKKSKIIWPFFIRWPLFWLKIAFTIAICSISFGIILPLSILLTGICFSPFSLLFCAVTPFTFDQYIDLIKFLMSWTYEMFFYFGWLKWLLS